MKILHLSVCRELLHGKRKQLQYEYNASREFRGVKWVTIAMQVNRSEDNFEMQYPVLFRSLFMRKFYAWLFLLKEKSNYDIILMRYMPFDPFILIFGWFVGNRVSIHHAKETEELKLVRSNWKGGVASLLERITGFVNSRQVKAMLGVTNEIAQYQAKTNNAKCPIGYYPNGIELEQVEILQDLRSEGIHIAFICGTFSAWHGLDRLIEAVNRYNSDKVSDMHVTIHLIGRMDQGQAESIKNLSLKNIKILRHGYLFTQEYNKVLAECDIGLGSLALDRENLSEATTLKVREYLASGLPVYSGFKDSAIPETFPYYRRGPIKIESIISFALEMKKVNRLQVRKASEPYIQKLNIMKELLVWLKEKLL